MRDADWFKLSQEFVFWLVVIIFSLVLSLSVQVLIPLAYAILAVPMVLFSIRQGTKMGISLVLAIAVVLSLLFSKKAGIDFLAEFGVLSQALVFGFRRKFNSSKIIFISFVFTVLAFVVVSMGTTIFSQNSIFTSAEQQIEESFQDFREAYESQELPAEQKEALVEGLHMAKSFSLKAYVGMSISFILFLVVSNYMVSKSFLSKIGYELADVTPFTQLKWPDELVWGFIASAGLFAISKVMPSVPAINLVGLNATVIFATFYLIQGWAILLFWGHRSKLPTFLKILGLILIIFQPFFLLPITAAGLFDIWFDLRKLQKEPVI